VLLAACSSSSSGPRQERKAFFESVVRQVAGPGATDCGTTGPRLPSNVVRECAATNLTRRDPFFAIRYEQGVESDTGTGWVLDSAGRLFVVSYDELDCRTIECTVTVAECGKLEILKEWEWFRAGSCEGRPLPAVPGFGAGSNASDSHR
jgi:hypothetical protein